MLGCPSLHCPGGCGSDTKTRRLWSHVKYLPVLRHQDAAKCAAFVKGKTMSEGQAEMAGVQPSPLCLLQDSLQLTAELPARKAVKWKPLCVQDVHGIGFIGFKQAPEGVGEERVGRDGGD